MAWAFQAFPPKPSSVGARSSAPSPAAAGIRTPTRTSPSAVLASRRRAEAGSWTRAAPASAVGNRGRVWARYIAATAAA